MSAKSRNASRFGLGLDLDVTGRYVTADNADTTE